MLTKLHKILIAALAVQLGLAIVMFVRSDDSAAARPRPLLADFDAAKVTRLLVSSPQSKKPIDLVKRDSGWVLASHFDHPVAESKVTDLLSSLAKMAAASPIATQPSRHKQLRVADDDHERKLHITIGGKETTVILGGPAGSRRTAVRLGTDARVFAVQGISAWAAGIEPRMWVDTSYVKVAKDEIAKIVVTRDGKSVELSRASATEPWTASIDGAPITLAAGESLDTAAIDSLVSAASTITLDEPGDPKRDASKPTATITIERTSTNNTSVAPVIVDVLESEDQYWVRQQGTAHAALVDKASLDDVVGVARDKLVKRDDPDGDGADKSDKAGKPAK